MTGRFTLSAWVNDEPIKIGEFVECPIGTFIINISWLDRLRSLIPRGPWAVKIRLSADPDMTKRVMDLVYAKE